MNNFSTINLPASLLKTLDTMNFTTPTPIQAQTIPLALAEGQDILGTAQTGTGKTGAFAIPLVAKLMNKSTRSVLVLAPTRELAIQVVKFFQQLLASDRSIRTALLIGGEPLEKQYRQLRGGAHVIVGTPGRINDHLNRGSLRLDQTGILVLDETDLMLDLGFDVQIATIIERMPHITQTLMFSATLPKKIEHMAGKYLNNPARVSIGAQSAPQEHVLQETCRISPKEKYATLCAQLDKREGSVIIFVKTRKGADRLALRLQAEGHTAAAIHGDLHQRKRERVLKAFRNKRNRIMVATDVASRGIDIPHIRHVINYDLPQCAEDYIHRIGRTARAGKKGEAISFVTKEDRRMWQAIERLLDPTTREEAQAEGSPRRRPARRKGSSSHKRRSSFRGSRPAGSASRRGKRRG